MKEERMSETLRNTPDSNLAPVIPLQREGEPFVDFSKLPAEEVIDGFITMYSHHPAYSSRRGSTLAELLHRDMTGSADTPHTLGSRLDQLEHEVSSAWRFAEVYDHKDEYDPVFHQLAEILQSTKKTSDVGLQRKVALKLLNLRATLRDDTTAHDTEWLDISDRLFH